ncbi:NUDIX hydrolase [Hyphobacterium sp. CCMP332]|uniref:NUDIX hydrolase n=1 Tax=Hyphobacterium sp. CCMP332 TaxID=2749086 RepID=UPI00164F7880|nr:NUDIX hydrolase [Hyphobacterium sp. CCMP332]QNL19212.1 NUDIX hydrolase [Hyphobacterium sp. CCMP332]
MTKQKRPLACVGVVCRRGNDVLLIKRGREPLKGKWSIPGGKIDFGEAVRDAALRELKEETGVEGRITRLIDVVDSIIDGQHYVLIDFEAEWVSGEPVADDDAAAAEFVPVEEAMRRVSWDETRRVITPA